MKTSEFLSDMILYKYSKTKEVEETELELLESLILKEELEELL